MLNKLIHENILQQYIFEKLSFTTKSEYNKYLPNFLDNETIKIVIPEFTRKGFDENFILLTEERTQPVSIQVEWVTSNFNKNFENFNKEKGYLMVLYNDLNDLKIKDTKKFEKLKQLEIVEINTEQFKEWFIKNSHKFISQTLAAYHPNIPVRNQSKYWVIYISKGESERHYFEVGRKTGKWAFRYKKRIKNVMDVTEGDYVIFVAKNSQKRARTIYPEEKDWSFSHVDIFKVIEGYYCDWTDNCFEKIETVGLAEKEFMHFFKFDKKAGTEFSFIQKEDSSMLITGDKFSSKNEEDIEFCDALRNSNAQSSSPFSITPKAFRKFRVMIEKEYS